MSDVKVSPDGDGWIKCEWDVPKGHKESFMFFGKSIWVKFTVDGDKERNGVYIEKHGFWTASEYKMWRRWLDKAMRKLRDNAIKASMLKGYNGRN